MTRKRRADESSRKDRKNISSSQRFGRRVQIIRGMVKFYADVMNDIHGTNVEDMSPKGLAVKTVSTHDALFRPRSVC